MKQAAILALALLVLAGLAVALVGCAAEDRARAERARAEQAAAQAQAGIVRAEAEAYEQRQQADTQAAAERAAIRQEERDAAHQRTMDNLPFVVVIGGGVLLAGLALLMFWDFRGQRAQQAPAADATALLVYLDRRDRELWHAIASLDRRQLAAGDNGGNSRGEVVIYDYKRK